MADDFLEDDGQEPINLGKKIIDTAIEEKIHGDLPVVVKDYLVIAEVMSEDGTSLLVSTGPDTTPWAIYGLLQYGERFFDDQFYNPNFNPDIGNE